MKKGLEPPDSAATSFWEADRSRKQPELYVTWAGCPDHPNDRRASRASQLAEDCNCHEVPSQSSHDCTLQRPLAYSQCQDCAKTCMVGHAELLQPQLDCGSTLRLPRLASTASTRYDAMNVVARCFPMLAASGMRGPRCCRWAWHFLKPTGFARQFSEQSQWPSTTVWLVFVETTLDESR